MIFSHQIDDSCELSSVLKEVVKLYVGQIQPAMWELPVPGLELPSFAY
jgi:hypothetical protein